MKIKKCAICGNLATTKEHVFAKCFFNKPYPSNMMTVSTCSSCNNSFSLDEEFLMYLIDYLKSIECNNGDFTREKARRCFSHGESKEDRTIESLFKDGDSEQVYFQEESTRIIRVMKKTTACLLTYHGECIQALSNLMVKYSFKPQLSDTQIKKIDLLPWIIVQEGLVKYAYSTIEVAICLSDFFFCSVTRMKGK